MDRLSPILTGVIGYSFISFASNLLIQPPKHLEYKEQKNYNGYYVSLIHSVIATWLSLMTLIQEGGVAYESETSQVHLWVMGQTLGYFIYDSIYGEYFQVNDFLMRLHHVVVITGGFTFYYLPIGGSLTMYVQFLTESSNPCMQMRLILKTEDRKESAFYSYVEYTFATLFIFNRGILAPFLVFSTWYYNLPFFIKICSSLLLGVSLIWICIILAMISKKFEHEPKCWLLLEAMKVYKQHSYYCIAGILTVSLVAPTLLKFLGFTPIHPRLFGVNIV